MSVVLVEGTKVSTVSVLKKKHVMTYSCVATICRSVFAQELGSSLESYDSNEGQGSGRAAAGGDGRMETD